MIPAFAQSPAQLSAFIFIAILIVAGVVIMGLTPDDILDPRSDHDLDNDEPPTRNPSGADILYKGVVAILIIGLIGIVVTTFLH